MMFKKCVSVGFIALSALAGCAQPQHLTNLPPSELNRPYTLAGGDRVRIIVFGQDNLSNSYSVDGSGNVSMPLIGVVRAQGRTAPQLADEIAGRLRGGFLRDPKVSAEVEAFRPFFILGEVTTAGQYPFINGMTVETAVAVAGGFGPRAARNSAQITRMINGRLTKSSVSIYQPLLPGDTITITERYF